MIRVNRVSCSYGALLWQVNPMSPNLRDGGKVDRRTTLGPNESLYREAECGHTGAYLLHQVIPAPTPPRQALQPIDLRSAPAQKVTLLTKAGFEPAPFRTR